MTNTGPVAAGEEPTATPVGEHPLRDAAVVDALALDAQLCFAMVAAARAVVAAYKPVLEPLGLTHPQYLVMLALWEHGPRTMSELSSAIRLEAPTVSPLVKRLESLGYVHRSRSSVDERVVEVELTDAGVRLREQALAVPPTMLNRLGLSPAEVESLRRSLVEFTARLDAR